MEVGESWLEGDTEVYEFVTKPDIHKYVPHKFKHFIPGGDLHYTDVIVSLAEHKHILSMLVFSRTLLGLCLKPFFRSSAAITSQKAVSIEEL